MKRVALRRLQIHNTSASRILPHPCLFCCLLRPQAVQMADKPVEPVFMLISKEAKPGQTSKVRRG